MQKNLKKIILAFALLCLFNTTANASVDFEIQGGKIGGGSSVRLIQAAKAQLKVGSDETACSIFVKKVMNRAGYPIGGFTANEFHKTMARHLPSWSWQAFTTKSVSGGRAALRAFLNQVPDQTAFLAQWVRSSGSGHVAMIVKESFNRFTIYQAQMGLTRPHKKPASVEQLLYPRNEYGDRSRLKLYFE